MSLWKLLKYAISFFGRPKPNTFFMCVCAWLFCKLKTIINQWINFQIDRACQKFRVMLKIVNVNEWWRNDNQSLNIIGLNVHANVRMTYFLPATLRICHIGMVQVAFSVSELTVYRNEINSLLFLLPIHSDFELNTPNKPLTFICQCPINMKQ